MAAPQEGYPAQGFPPAEPYAQPGYAAETPTGAAPQEHEGGKKKKRGYAAQAYDFGAGANSALGGQTHGGAAAGFPPAQAPAYGGYPQQPEAQPAYVGAPQYGAPPEVPGAPAPGAPVQPGFAAPAPYGSGVGGYQAPEPGYPGPAAPGAGGVAAITQGMAQMGVSGVPPPAQAARPAVLNHLYPTDLLTQPFNAAELELPPPPIILPANVSQSSLALDHLY